VERQAARAAAIKERQAAAKVAEQKLAEVAAVAAAAVEVQHERRSPPSTARAGNVGRLRRHEALRT
jgi:hypothetical protein